MPCGVVHTPDSLLDDPHLKAVNFFEPKFEDETGIVRTLLDKRIAAGPAA